MDSENPKKPLWLEKAKIFNATTIITIILVTFFLFTGTINTLSTKFQDLQIIKGFGRGPPSYFEHPFVQTCTMFMGELACMFGFLLVKLYQYLKQKNNPGHIQEEEIQLSEEEREKRARYVNPLIFAIPSILDLFATSLLYVGLLLTYTSVYQMLRGALVIFVATFSIIFLKKKYGFHHFLGIGLVVAGISMVGAASVIYSSSDAHTAKSPLLGALLVVAAQIVHALQFVYEESICSRYHFHSLQIVGWEGFWGLSAAIIILFGMYWSPGEDYGSFQSFPFALAQVLRSPYLLGAILTSATSIAFFNFFGIMIMKRLNATAKSTIDASRTLFVWLFSMIIGWETFKPLQLAGFVVLVSGSFLYNEVITIPVYHKWWKKKVEERERRLKEKKELEKMKKISYNTDT